VPTLALFTWFISRQAAVLFSQNKPAIRNQPSVFFSPEQTSISHQPPAKQTCYLSMHGAICAPILAIAFSQPRAKATDF
jgi:hypothetical protein